MGVFSHQEESSDFSISGIKYLASECTRASISNCGKRKLWASLTPCPSQDPILSETIANCLAAVGPLRIYRAPGSVAFLNCANALRPILPKSQAWCVDGDSKFVLQVRRPQYWRIEVSNKTSEEKSKVDELKKVLEEVLLFEKTPCPFQRDFVVELPQAPKTPATKRPWKPVQGPKVNPPSTPEAITENGYGNAAIGKRASSSSPLRQSTPCTTQRRNSVMDLGASKQISPSEPQVPLNFPSSSSNCPATTISETAEPSELSPKRTPSPRPPSPALASFAPVEQEMGVSAFESSQSIFADCTGFDDSDNFSDATDDTNMTPRGRVQSNFQPLTFEPEKHERPQAMQNCSRFITAPPVLSLVTSPPSKHRTTSPLRSSAISETDSDFSSSVESFHTVQSWHSPLAPPSPPASGPPSPTQSYPYPHNNIVLPKRPQHAREASELTVTPDTPRVWDINAIPGSERARRGSSPQPKTPTLVNDASEKSDEEQFEVVTPPTVRQGIRHRATTSSNSRRRELSPLPAAVNLFSPTRRRSRRLQTSRHLPTAIIQKTCEILLSPPSHLLHLMLNIASKIAAGEWRGVLSGHGEAVHWDFEDEYGVEGWFEDDYGISLPHAPIKAKKSVNNTNGGSWEVD
jgi:hypothetical protein